MAQKQTYLTREGVKKLEAELEHLKTVRRHEVAERIQRAKEIGGTVDNAEYEEAKNEQAFVEGRILTLESLLATAVVISDEHAPDVVTIGSTVVVENEQGKQERYTIVGSAEADPLQGRISNESPVGKALIDHRVGDVVEVPTPRGVSKLIVRKVE